jgi:hydrogenase nickel incorporation protein HypA/HybF
MHELALMESVVCAVGERIGAARVVAVRLEVGRLAAVVPEALRFCFDVCARGTTLEGASLTIDEIPGRGQCRACGAEQPLESFYADCPCGSTDFAVLAGQELRVKTVEVETEVA